MSQLVRLLRHQERELETREQSFQNYFQPHGLQRTPPHTRVPGLGWLFPPRPREHRSGCLPTGSTLAELIAPSSAEPCDTPSPERASASALRTSASDRSALDGIAVSVAPDVMEASRTSSRSSSASSSTPSLQLAEGREGSGPVQPSAQNQDTQLASDPWGSISLGSEPSLKTASGLGGAPEHSVPACMAASALPPMSISPPPEPNTCPQQRPGATSPSSPIAGLNSLNDHGEGEPAGHSEMEQWPKGRGMVVPLLQCLMDTVSPEPEQPLWPQSVLRSFTELEKQTQMLLSQATSWIVSLEAHTPVLKSEAGSPQVTADHDQLRVAVSALACELLDAVERAKRDTTRLQLIHLQLQELQPQLSLYHSGRLVQSGADPVISKCVRFREEAPARKVQVPPLPLCNRGLATSEESGALGKSYARSFSRGQEQFNVKPSLWKDKLASAVHFIFPDSVVDFYQTTLENLKKDYGEQFEEWERMEAELDEHLKPLSSFGASSPVSGGSLSISDLPPTTCFPRTGHHLWAFPDPDPDPNHEISSLLDKSPPFNFYGVECTDKNGASRKFLMIKHPKDPRAARGKLKCVPCELRLTNLLLDQMGADRREINVIPANADDLKAPLPSVRSRSLLHRPEDNVIISAKAMEDYIVDRFGRDRLAFYLKELEIQSLAELYGTKEFRLPASELLKLEQHTKLYVGPNLPPLFALKLISIVSRDEVVQRYSELRDISLNDMATVDKPCELGQFIRDLNNSKDLLETYGFFGNPPFSETTSQSLAELSTQMCVACPGYFLVNDNFQITAKATKPILFLGAVAINMRSGSSAPDELAKYFFSSNPRFIPNRREELKKRVKQMYQLLFKACKDFHVTHPVIAPIGGYKSVSNIEKHSVLALYQEALFELLDEQDYGFEVVFLNSGNSSPWIAESVLHKGHYKLKCKLVHHQKDSRALTALVAEKYNTAFLYESDFVVTMQGCAGNRWAKGERDEFSVCEALCCSSTSILARSSICSLWSAADDGWMTMKRGLQRIQFLTDACFLCSTSFVSFQLQQQSEMIVTPETPRRLPQFHYNGKDVYLEADHVIWVDHDTVVGRCNAKLVRKLSGRRVSVHKAAGTEQALCLLDQYPDTSFVVTTLFHKVDCEDSGFHLIGKLQTLLEKDRKYNYRIICISDGTLSPHERSILYAEGAHLVTGDLSRLRLREVISKLGVVQRRSDRLCKLLRETVNRKMQPDHNPTDEEFAVWENLLRQGVCFGFAARCFTPLHFLAVMKMSSTQLKTVRRWVTEYDADVNAETRFTRSLMCHYIPKFATPLYVAVEFENIDMIKTLIRLKANPDAACGEEHKLTPLELARQMDEKSGGFIANHLINDSALVESPSVERKKPQHHVLWISLVNTPEGTIRSCSGLKGSGLLVDYRPLNVVEFFTPGILECEWKLEVSKWLYPCLETREPHELPLEWVQAVVVEISRKEDLPVWKYVLNLLRQFIISCFDGLPERFIYTCTTGVTSEALLQYIIEDESLKFMTKATVFSSSDTSPEHCPPLKALHQRCRKSSVGYNQALHILWVSFSPAAHSGTAKVRGHLGSFRSLVVQPLLLDTNGTDHSDHKMLADLESAIQPLLGSNLIWLRAIVIDIGADEDVAKQTATATSQRWQLLIRHLLDMQEISKSAWINIGTYVTGLTRDLIRSYLSTDPDSERRVCILDDKIMEGSEPSNHFPFFARLSAHWVVECEHEARESVAFNAEISHRIEQAYLSGEPSCTVDDTRTMYFKDLTLRHPRDRKLWREARHVQRLPSPCFDSDRMIRSLCHLRSEVTAGNCVLFLGAGFCAPVKGPTWKELLLTAAESTKDKNLLNTVEKLLKRGSHSDYELAAQILEDKKNLQEFIMDQLKSVEKGSRIREKRSEFPVMASRLEHVECINFNAVLTTNYSQELCRCMGGGCFALEGSVQAMASDLRGSPRNLVCSLCAWPTPLMEKGPSYLDILRFRPDGRKPRPILQLHGSVRETGLAPNGCDNARLVLSSEGYRKLLHKCPAYPTFLKSLMSCRTILYVGFSFTDDYLNQIRSEVMAMRVTKETKEKVKQTPEPEPLAYAFIPDQSKTYVEHFRQHEGVRFVTWPSPLHEYGAVDRLLSSLLRMTQMAAALSGSTVILSQVGHPTGAEPESMASLYLTLSHEAKSTVFEIDLYPSFQLERTPRISGVEKLLKVGNYLRAWVVIFADGNWGCVPLLQLKLIQFLGHPHNGLPPTLYPPTLLVYCSSGSNQDVLRQKYEEHVGVRFCASYEEVRDQFLGVRGSTDEENYLRRELEVAAILPPADDGSKAGGTAPCSPVSSSVHGQCSIAD
eukprot:RCo053411